MSIKRKSPTTLAGDTGNIVKTKNTKRKRITHYKLALKWSQIPKICVMERSL
jgi:hypothetical protein